MHSAGLQLSQRFKLNIPQLSHRFRHTDGQWHYGIAKSKDLERVHMEFLRPTKPHMLSGIHVQPGLLKPARHLNLADTQLAVGSRVLARSRCSLRVF